LRRAIVRKACLLAVLLAAAPQPAGGQDLPVAVQSTPANVAQIRTLWQLYQAAEGEPERAERLAERIIELRHRAGMLGSTGWARAFAMRGWRCRQAGELNAAVAEYRTAVALEPSAREFRVAMASALAARNPLDVGSYMPAYLQAVWGSFDSARGRYLLLADSVLWIGFTLLFAGCLWSGAMLIRYLLVAHHTLAELLAVPFGPGLAGLLAAAVIVSPLAFGVHIGWVLLGLTAAVWAFQKRGERVVSVAALVFLWLGAGLVALSSGLAAGMTTLSTQAAFAAERFDADETVVQGLEDRLLRAGAIAQDGSLSVPDDQHGRLELFLYACSLRKLGLWHGRGGLEILEIFEALGDDEAVGPLAAVNAANIRLERGEFSQARIACEELREREPARPYALFNLWRLHYEHRNTDRAQELWDTLTAAYPGFVRRFRLDDESLQPATLDAGPTPAQISGLIDRGLAAATLRSADSVAPTRLLQRELQRQIWWPAAALGGMIVALLVFGRFGAAVSCTSCGRIYCRHCDINPRTSEVCQSCSAVLSPGLPLDSELRRSQRARIDRHERWGRILYYPQSLLVPGLGHATSGRTLVGCVLILGWSALAALLYCADRFPRAESFPFFSHWTPLIGIAAVALALATYLPALLRREKPE